MDMVQCPLLMGATFKVISLKGSQQTVCLYSTLHVFISVRLKISKQMAKASIQTHKMVIAMKAIGKETFNMIKGHKIIPMGIDM